MARLFKIITSAIIAAVAAYMILIFWQLNALDKIIKKHSHESFHIYAIECESLDNALFSRKLKFLVSFDQNSQESTPFLKMEGKFTPGLFPSVELKAIPLVPKKEIFVKANLKLNLEFDCLVNLNKAKLSWDKAQENGEILGEGHLSADIDFDKDKRIFRSLDVKGELDEARFLWDGGSYYLGKNSLKYSYQDEPRKFNFMYKSTGDRIETDFSLPQIKGPYFYKYAISNNKEENVSEYEFKCKDLFIDADTLPSLDFYMKGNFITSSEVWMPCIFSKLIGASEFLALPGACPFESSVNSLENLSFEDIRGKISAFNLSWQGADIKITGDFGKNKSFDSNFEVIVDFDKALKPEKDAYIAQQVTNELKNYIEILASEGAFKKINDNSYKTDLQIKMVDGTLKITGNGVDLQKILYITIILLQFLKLSFADQIYLKRAAAETKSFSFCEDVSKIAVYKNKA